MGGFIHSKGNTWMCCIGRRLFGSRTGDIPTVRKNSRETDLKKLISTMRKVLLTGDAIMEAEDFLSHCNFLDIMDDECIQCFKYYIKEITHMERLWLCKCVTMFEFL